MTDYYTNIVIP